MATKTIKIGLSDSDKAAMESEIAAQTLSALVSAYSSSSTYYKGDYVCKDGELYRATQNISTPEAWNASHWESVTLNDIIDDVNEGVASIDGKLSKGDYDGTTGVGYADLADNLIATKGLIVNDDPMSFGIVGGAQKSAVGDGNASLNKLVCVDVVKNQLSQIEDASERTNDGVTWKITGHKMTATGTATANIYNSWETIALIAGHNYLINGASTMLYRSGQSLTHDGDCGIVACSVSGNYTYQWNIRSGTVVNYNFLLFVIDLTQRYGNNDVVNAIIGTGTDAEKVARLIAFDPEILNDTDYDAGTLVPSKTAKLLPVGVNQWDEEWELGGITNTGILTNQTDRIRSKNYIRVVPNSIIYCFGAYCYFRFYDKERNFVGLDSASDSTMVVPSNAIYAKFFVDPNYGATYKGDICINISDPNINGKYYPSKRNPVTLPNYEGHGILKVVDGKVVADGTELYPDGNSKKRYVVVDLSTLVWNRPNGYTKLCVTNSLQNIIARVSSVLVAGNLISTKYVNVAVDTIDDTTPNTIGLHIDGRLFVNVDSTTETPTGYLVYSLATEEDITTPVFQSTFPVEQGGTLQFLDEDNNPIAGLQGSEIFYQKNIKAFVEALGEATDWNPERIKRLGKLSFTPEYVDITVTGASENAYTRAQVYNASFVIVVHALLAGTPNGTLTIQDAEIDLSGFQTEPGKKIIDEDGVSADQAPTTPNCYVGYYIGRTRDGNMKWDLVHSGANKLKMVFRDTVQLDANGENGIDCRVSLML